MFNNSNLWTGAFVLFVTASLIVASTFPTACSNSTVREMTWGLDLMKSEQASNQSVLYLTEQVLEWEKKADDFSMHEDWMARKTDAHMRLTELDILIPDLQAQIDKCN